jgi:hypothetical protein
MRGLSATEQAELNDILLYDEARDLGTEITAFCPDCPTGHFHSETHSEAGITYGGWEDSHPDNPTSWGWLLHQWEMDKRAPAPTS